MASSYGYVRENRIIQIIEEGDNDKWVFLTLICSTPSKELGRLDHPVQQDTTNCFKFQRAIPTKLHSFALFRG